MKVSINIVTWNSFKYLPDCLQSIFNQTFENFSLLVIDNGSTDETMNFIRHNYGNRVTILRNFKNLGFSHAHNQGIELAKKEKVEFILIINPDIILAPNFLEELILEAEKRPEGGSFGGKLLKITIPPPSLRGKGSMPESKIIDSLGLKIFKNRRVIELGGGEKNNRRDENIVEVFGISGALTLYRSNALEDVKLSLNNSSEYFDEDFFTYKEDIDLAWRLRLFGWKAIYVPRAIAFHHRLAPSKEKIRVNETIKLRKERPRTINYFSYKNHLLMLFKNEYLSNFLIHFPHIFWYELKKFIYLLFFEPKTLKALGEFFIQLPRIWQKRKIIMKRAKVGPKEIRKWFK